MERSRPTGSGRPRGSRLALKLALVCGVLASSLLLVELTLHALGVPSLRREFVSATFDGELFVEDPERFWRLSPTCEKFQVNEVGLRGWWPEGPAPDGELRILCVGDSCTFGTGVRYDETYGVVLARTLSNSALDFKARSVLLALPGYSTYQDLVLLRQRVDELQPDLVVLYCGAWNDYLPAWLRTDADWGAVAKSGVVSRLAELGKRAMWSNQHGDPAKLVDDYRDGVAPPLLRVPLDDYRDNLRALIAAVEAAGAQPVLVSPAFPKATLARFSMSRRYLQATRAVAADTGVLSVDGTAAIDAFEADQQLRDGPTASELSFTDWIHPSGIGHGLIASAISAKLESIGWPARRADQPPALARPVVSCAVEGGVASVAWAPVAGAEGYWIYFEELASGKIGAIDCGAKTSLQVPVSDEGAFKFCVQAQRWGAQSRCSAALVVGG